MRKYLALLVCVSTLLVAGATAHAQQQDWTTRQCNSTQVNQIRAAVTAALAKQAQAANSNMLLAAYQRAFGTYTGNAYTWNVLTFLYYEGNIPAVLTNAASVNPLGPPPNVPPMVYTCASQDVGNLVGQKGGDGNTILYPVFFRLPLKGYWPTDTQVGAILHEAIHILGGPMDIRVNGAEDNVSAEMLAAMNDSRSLTNAYNYEYFYTGREFPN